MDKILIVIPVINLWNEYTIHCLESIVSQKCDVPFGVLLIDNGSTDATIEHAEDFAGRKLPEGRMQIIANKKNNGVSGAWNQGIQVGIDQGYSHIAVVNNDTRFGPHMLQRMYDRMKKGDVLLVSSNDVLREVIVPEDVLNEAHAVNNKPEGEAPHPNFACFMVTPETVQKVGYFDEGFFPAFFEDNDYHYRCKLAGGPNAAIALTHAVFVHFGSRTQNQEAGKPVVPGEKFRENERYFITKWGGVPGREQYSHPFNDANKDHTYAKRN